MVKLKEYLPDYYGGVREMNSLMNAEQPTFDKFDDEIERLLMNQFVTQADSQGLSIMEHQLSLPTDLNRSLESRRYDVLIRLLPPRPITIWYFRELVQSMDIPALIDIKYAKQHVVTMSEASVISAEQIKRLRYLLNVLLPTNLTYQITTESKTNSTTNLYVGTATQVTVHTVVMPKRLTMATVGNPQYYGSTKPQIYVHVDVDATGGDELNE